MLTTCDSCTRDAACTMASARIDVVTQLERSPAWRDGRGRDQHIAIPEMAGQTIRGVGREQIHLAAAQAQHLDGVSLEPARDGLADKAAGADDDDAVRAAGRLMQVTQSHDRLHAGITAGMPSA